MTDKAGDIAILIKKHIQEELTDKERNALTDWVNTSAENRKVFLELTNEDSLQQAIREFHEFEQEYDGKVTTSVVSLYDNKINWFKYIAVSAAVITLVSMILLFTYNNHSKKQVAVVESTTIKMIQDLAPGGNKAVLTLADGSKIILDHASNGMLTQQGSTDVVKNADGEVTYNASKEKSAITASYNLITTPRGGQFKLTLPDGSLVWLNAASSLKFPVSFTGKERVVQLTGEAYFEVAHVNIAGSLERMPFEVQVNNGMKVQVLGTHFNVNGYDDESAVKTTLLEGKVKVTNTRDNNSLISVYLQPGQQASLTKADGNLGVQKDAKLATAAIAWTHQKFSFTSADVKTVMRQLARWYDVEIEYAGNLPEKTFSGEIPRDLKASEVLSLINFAGIRFQIEGKKIKVLP